MESTREQAQQMGAFFDRNIIGDCPLILFISPARCGKSMVLMSLVEYLRSFQKQYAIKPNYDYIPNNDQYRQKCDDFINTLKENAGKKDGWKAPLDGTVDEILVDIKDGQNGPTKYRMLEAPGEDFFSLNNPGNDYADYLKEIISKTREENYPVYYVMLLDLHTDNNNFNNKKDSKRGLYEERLITFFENGYDSKRGDKVVLLYNKIDEAMKTKTQEEALRDLLQEFYTDIKDKLKRRRWVFFKVPVYNGVLPYKSGRWEKKENSEGKTFWMYKTDKESIGYAKKLWEELTSVF